MEIINRLNAIYENTKYKNLYTVILTGISLVLIIIIPFFAERSYLFGSYWFDLIIRIIVTFWFYRQIHFVSHLDQYYEKMYKGASKPIFSEPSILKQLINILVAIFSGGLAYVFYNAILRILIPNIGITGIIISILFGVFTFLPLFSQYKKR